MEVNYDSFSTVTSTQLTCEAGGFYWAVQNIGEWPHIMWRDSTDIKDTINLDIH